MVVLLLFLLLLYRVLIPNMGDHDGWTPIMVGSQNGHNDVLDLLLKAKANPNACLKDETLVLKWCYSNYDKLIVN